jgi:hypothetical protein
VPNFFQDGGPYLIVQGRDKVVIIDEAGPVVRHVYLNVPHSPNLKPSWMGESVGRYEGDTLVIDTIGMNTKVRQCRILCRASNRSLCLPFCDRCAAGGQAELCP